MEVTILLLIAVPYFCLGQRVGSAGVEPVSGLNGAALDKGICAYMEIKVNDRERRFPTCIFHAPEKRRREDMDTVKSPAFIGIGQPSRAYFLCGLVEPAT